MNIIMRALGNIDEKYLDEAVNYQKKPIVLKLAMPIAACFVVLSCLALYSLSPTTQSDGILTETTANDNNTDDLLSPTTQLDETLDDNHASDTEGAVDGSTGSTLDMLIFEYWGEVVEILEDNSAIIQITQTDSNLEIYDGLFFDVGEDVIVNFAVNSNVNVGDLIQFTNENYFILEGEIYEIDEENYS